MEVPLNIRTPRQLGAIVREHRREFGLTQRELAERSRVSERLISSLETGDAKGIRLDKLLAVLDALHLSLNVDGDEDSNELSANSPVDDTYARAFELMQQNMNADNTPSALTARW